MRPKREVENEFNDLQKALSSYVQGLGIDQLIYGVLCPTIVRMVKGSGDPGTEDRPYATTKIHVDPWAGDPADEVVVFMPVLGDISRTTAKFFQPPKEHEAQLSRPMPSFDLGLALIGECEPYPLQQRAGYAYFTDAIVPHRTVKHGGGARVTVEVRFRRRTTEEERIAIENVCVRERLVHYIDVASWHSLGTTKRMKFSDTYANAKRGIFTARPYEEPTYTLAEI